MSSAFCVLSHMASGEGSGIRLYRFLSVAFSSACTFLKERVQLDLEIGFDTREFQVNARISFLMTSFDLLTSYLLNPTDGGNRSNSLAVRT